MHERDCVVLFAYKFTQEECLLFIPGKTIWMGCLYEENRVFHSVAFIDPDGCNDCAHAAAYVLCGRSAEAVWVYRH